jgi:RND family efflux transporter MFP subunit
MALSRRFIQARRLSLSAALLVTSALVACSKGGPAGPPKMPPVGVGVQQLANKPVVITSEYIAVIKSRRSSDVRPQVEGVITDIFAKSGDRVTAGKALLQIDASKQQATVESDEASRIAQDEAVHYAQQQFERAKQLLSVGAISQQEYEQAETALKSTTATQTALKARVQESRVQLQYYRVTSPTDGTVGDIPVRIGDRVKTDTVLTTVDQKAGLEVYIQVPIERGPDVRTGLPVQIVDARGQVLAESTTDFVSPQVDDKTQSILVKAAIPSDKDFRTEQFVRARVVWRSQPGLTIPAVAVTRINGQYFAFVAEAQGNGFVARQRTVKVGELVGNDYVVEAGLAVGDRLIVSGVQKIGDGAPVQPQG